MSLERIREYGSGLILGFLGMLMVLYAASAQEVKLPYLKTRNGTFTNVTVISRSKNDIYIRFDRGSIGNVKIKDIEDDDALIALGFKTTAKEEGAGSFGFSAALTNQVITKIIGTNQSLRTLMNSPVMSQVSKLREVKWTWGLIAGVAGAWLAMFLFWSFCLKLICVKAGTKPGGLVWIPILQMIPMFKAAGMSGWWLLGMFVPLLNIVGVILWAFKIAQARAKSVWTAIALLLPVISLFAFLYLAFSSAQGPTLKKDSTGP